LGSTVTGNHQTKHTPGYEVTSTGHTRCIYAHPKEEGDDEDHQDAIENAQHHAACKNAEPIGDSSMKNFLDTRSPAPSGGQTRCEDEHEGCGKDAGKHVPVGRVPHTNFSTKQLPHHSCAGDEQAEQGDTLDIRMTTCNTMMATPTIRTAPRSHGPTNINPATRGAGGGANRRHPASA
jgi:hypothetical protein